MSTTTLYLARHGETDYNRRAIVQGRRINSRLNALGQAQAAALAERLADVTLDRIFTSTQTRAVETASAVAARHPHVPVVPLRDLEEMSWGRLEGEPSSPHTKAVFDEIYTRWAAGDYEARVPEGESILEVQARALRAYRHILDTSQGQTVLVVAHGRLLRVLLASVLSEYGLARMHDIRHANTSLNRLVVDVEGQARADLLNCVAHLETVTTTMVE